VRRFYGYDGMQVDEVRSELPLMPKRETELSNLQIVVDGRRWRVPNGLYNDLLDPDIGLTHEAVRLSPSGKSMDVEFAGSDGGGGYFVRWTFRRSGKDRRRVGAGDLPS
jgi:hypothetical protein